MSDIALPVLEYIYELLVKDRCPAFFLTDIDGALKNWGGEPERYGITNLEKERLIEDYILFLQGFFPLEDTPLFLPCIETESGISADVHIFSHESDYWLLLLDSTAHEAQITELQQELNELRLFRDKQAKLLQQHIDQKNSEQETHLILRDGGEYKYVSVLFADIRRFTTHNHVSSEEMFESLDAYIGSMMRGILDEGGVVDKIIGDAVMGIFGTLPSGLAPPLQAVRAAFRMMESIGVLKNERKAGGKTPFDIGIGIASGQVGLGIIGTWDRRKTLSAVGHPVNLAALLEKEALPNEILIDPDTFHNIPDFQSCFSKITLSPAENGEAKNVRSFPDWNLGRGKERALEVFSFDIGK